MRQMGKAIGIIARSKAAEEFMHADISAWGAPGECHGMLTLGEPRRERQARRLAKSVSGLSRRVFNRELRKIDSRVIDRAVSRIYARDYPF